MRHISSKVFFSGQHFRALLSPFFINNTRQPEVNSTFRQVHVNSRHTATLSLFFMGVPHAVKLAHQGSLENATICDTRKLSEAPMHTFQGEQFSKTRSDSFRSTTSSCCLGQVTRERICRWFVLSTTSSECHA